MPRINGLTPRDFKFLQVVIRQIKETGKVNLTKAGLEAFNTQNPKTASVVASQTLENPNIQEQIKQAFIANGLTLETISENLGYYANKRAEKVGAEASIKANVELLKLLNAYPGQKKTTVSLSMKANLNKMGFNELKAEMGKVDEELKRVMDGEVVKDTP